MTTSQPFQLLLLRHGITDSNARGIIQGHLPIPLNALGHEQARQLAKHLASWSSSIQAIVTSDLLRARQTAEHLARELKLTLTLDPAWRERGLGEFEGKSVDERMIWMAASGEQSPPGAETPEAFHGRIHDALIALPQRFPASGPVAIVTHGGPIRAILRMFQHGQLKLTTDQTLEAVETVGNCSIWHLELRDDAWRIACANEMSHLEQSTDSDTG